MRRIFQTSQFRKDFKRIQKRGKDTGKLKSVVSMLSAGVSLEARHCDHPLAGKWSGSRDCHVEPDWILIYRMDGESLYLERTGSHGDLFR